MKISIATRTHLIYQFIILILLFLGNGCEILLDRKVITFLVFLPILCYQLVVLLCCMELIPIPSWMSFLQLNTKESSISDEKFEKDIEVRSSPVKEARKFDLHSKAMTFPEVAEILPSIRRCEKSVTNLGASPKCFVYPQKSKSWMNLSDSRSSEKLSSREGSLDILTSTEQRCPAEMKTKNGEIRKRAERQAKAKSWKTGISDFKLSGKSELVKSFSLKEHAELHPVVAKDNQEESELEKSYSFPFRQKRLQSWLEMKESNVGLPSQSPDIPYWQTVGYILAVKYEARRRRRAISNSRKTEASNPDSNIRKSTENVPDVAAGDKPNSKKSSKSSSACMNKIKAGFSNLVSKKKDDVTEDGNTNSDKTGKSALFKLKNKTVCQTKEREQTSLPEFPQFLNNDRSLIFYPRYLPFEKERFESDVRNKMLELDEQQKNNVQEFNLK